MGLGIGILFVVIIVSLVVAKVHGSFRLGQALYFVFVGLLLSSVFPGMPQAAHDFVTSLTTSVQHGSISK